MPCARVQIRALMYIGALSNGILEALASAERALSDAILTPVRIRSPPPPQPSVRPGVAHALRLPLLLERFSAVAAHVAGAGMPCPCISRRDAAAQHVSGNKHGRHGVSSALVGRCGGSARVHTRPQPALLSAAVPATLTQRTHSGYPQGSKRCRRRIKGRVFALATSEQT